MNSANIKVGQIDINYILDGASTSGLGVFELTVPPGSNVPPPHSHLHNEECVYVLAGTLRYTVGTETRDLVTISAIRFNAALRQSSLAGQEQSFDMGTWIVDIH